MFSIRDEIAKRNARNDEYTNDEIVIVASFQREIETTRNANYNALRQTLIDARKHMIAIDIDTMRKTYKRYAS